jgi:hypothetical protein
MYDVLAEVHTNQSCYKRVELYVCLYIYESANLHLLAVFSEDCTSLLAGVLLLFTNAKFAISMFLTHSGFG